MGIIVKQFDGVAVSPRDDAIINDLIVNQSGVFNGVDVTFLGANQIRVGTGRMIVKGRQVTITEETVLVQLSAGGNKVGRLYLRLDASNSTTPASFLSYVGDILPKLRQDEDFNYSNGVYELELCNYNVNETSVKNMEVTYSRIEGCTKVLATIEEVMANTDASAVAGATSVKEVNSSLSNCMFTTEGSGANTKYYIQSGADTASKKLLGSSKYYKGSVTTSYLWLSTYSIDLKNYVSWWANTDVGHMLVSIISQTATDAVFLSLSYTYNVTTGIITINHSSVRQPTYSLIVVEK